MKRPLLLLALLLAFSLQGWTQPAPAKKPDGYAKRPDVQAFIREMVEQHGFVERELTGLFARVRRAEPILEAIVPKAPKARNWEEYRGFFLNDRRIAGGAAFWKAHAGALARAEKEYGVPAEYIVAIIGIETFYGRNTGKWRIVDALSTLAFDYPPRAEFFRDELINYLLLVREAGVDVFSMRGSYAGAIGIPQFMPGSLRRYAVDFDGNGRIDLQGSPTDAIGSVASFLSKHGWQPGGEVFFPARVSGEAWRPYADGTVDVKHAIADLARAGVEPQGLPERLAGARAALIELTTPERPSEFRLGLQNFWVLTRYNRSAFYASAVADLARALKKNQEAGR
jgi:membrane-bound lytic murein transglycosylase B